VLDIQDMASDELMKHVPFLRESVSPACPATSICPGLSWVVPVWAWSCMP
jgi:hypothetical protein